MITIIHLGNKKFNIQKPSYFNPSVSKLLFIFSRQFPSSHSVKKQFYFNSFLSLFQKCIFYSFPKLISLPNKIFHINRTFCIFYIKNNRIKCFFPMKKQFIRIIIGQKSTFSLIQHFYKFTLLTA